MTPDQDHALRTAAVWEQRRWEAAVSALPVMCDLNPPDEAAVKALAYADALIAAARGEG